MKERQFKRAVALLLSLCMCLSCLPAAVFAAGAETEPQTVLGTEEQTLEDSTVQLGEASAPAQEPENIPDGEEESEAPPAPAEEPEPENAMEAPETEAPEAPSAQVRPVRSGTVENEGRAYPGQVTMTVDGTEYILIGTRQQLQALDTYPAFISAGSLGENSAALTDAQRYDVTGPIWYVQQTRSSISSEWTSNATLVYPGDADLIGAYADYELYGVNGELPPQAGTHAGKKIGDTSTPFATALYERWIYCGGTLDQFDLEITSYSGKYNPKNNYVVFRNIDLNHEAWTPLMFYGTMIGVNGEELGSSRLTNKTLAAAVEAIVNSRRGQDYYGDGEDELNIKQPTISNITVSTSGQLDPSTYVGVGFFASVTSNRPGSDFSFSPIQAEVRNIKISNVEVTNDFTGIYVEQTLVNLLTSGLGKIVGRLLDVLLPILLEGSTSSDTNFTQSVSDLLAARQRDITNLATGGFAGRVDGLVLIENCDVENVQVNSGFGYTGGFVGYSTGCEQYLPVTGPLLSILEGLLNLIPGLGLGDLITIVSHVLHVNYLIPMDYLNPEISDCDIKGLSGDIGPAQADLANADWTCVLNNRTGDSILADTQDVNCNGGFVGCKIATMMVNCSVEDSSYTVWAKKYGGGFAGLARDAVIQELLSGLGIDLIESSNANLQSVQVLCKIKDSDVIVNGETCLGGFNGAMANAFCVNNEVDCRGKTFQVTGTEDCVGGFAGIATLGWAMNLGNQDDPGNEDLLSTVTHLLGTLGGGNFDASLLNLLGVGKSYVLGLQFDVSASEGNGTELEVTGRDYVGGLIGQGDAVVISGTTSEMLNEITYFEHGDLTARDAFPNMPARETFTVKYRPMTGASMANGASQTVTVGPGTYELTLPAATAPSGYTFEGWVTGNYDHADRKPDRIYPAGSTITVTTDLTLKGLFSKEGDEAYELVVGEPDSSREWGGDYVITHDVRGEEIRVLAGLDSGYYAGNVNGTKSLSDANIQVHSKYPTFLTGVTDLYVFTATKAAASGTDYYFKNKQKSTWLSAEDYDRDPSLLGTDYIAKLYAATSQSRTESQWKLGIRTEVGANDPIKDYYALLLESDTIHVTDWYLAFDATNNTFSAAKDDSTTPSIREIYLWKKSNLPTTYTTVANGQELTTEDLVISNIDAYVGDFAHVNARGLKTVTGRKYVGGLVGLADTASVSSLLGDTVGVGQFAKFDISELYAVGSLTDGLTVTGSDYYVGGGIGLAIGGDIHARVIAAAYDNHPAEYDPNGYGIKLDELKSVIGLNCVGGFAGCVGPGQLVGSGGLDVKLLGLSLIKANSLLSLGEGIVTTLDTVTVTGVADGYTVLETGSVEANGLAEYSAGGFFGRSNSTSANNCHAVKVQWVKGNNTDGRAGGFLGVSEVGGLASMDDAEGSEIKSLLQANNLLGAVGYLIPEYTNVDVRFINDGFVEAAWAGGFAADFESGTVDNSVKAENDWFAVYNIDHVTGTLYAGGFGGKVYSGALADAAGGISILGGLDVGINASDLLRLVNAYIPKIIKSGVKSDLSTRERSGAEELRNGFLVTVSGANDDKTTGAAGGFIGYGSGVQVSYSDVTLLRHTDVVPPAELEGKIADSYYDGRSAYAVTGTRYAGGYMGFMDVGSAASVGGGLKVLGESINLNNVLGALDVVISTVEHSDVYGAPGGFAVLATWTAEGASGGSGSAPSGSNVTVYVVDETDAPSFYAYVSHSDTGSNDGEAMPGHQLTALGNDRAGHPYYSFSVDTTLYNCVTFGNGVSGEGHREAILALNTATVTDGKLPAHVSMEAGGWTVSANGTDIWPASNEAHEGCRGTYTRYLSVLGAVEDVETVTNADASHSLGKWTPVEGKNRHYHECQNCGYRGQEANCTFEAGADFCTVCGRRNATLPESISEATGLVGRAGGFVGWLRGSHIQDSNSWNFSYIVGQIAAGGYAGEIEPGSVADALGPTDVLSGLVSTSGTLLSLAKDFVPTIRNSVTTCIPCGGAVRANAASDAETQRGMAGGYVGHNCGGQIWGNNDEPWKDEADPTDEDHKYNGPMSECAAIRILSVYGYEYAGGFTGLMESANTADTGSLSLLWGLVDANNLLGALSIVYPTEENTAVYGPLYGLDRTTWNTWVEYIGQYGGYGLGMEQYNDDASFEAALPNYLYGYHVAAGRDEYSTEAIQVKGGYAGGYVGAMRTGTITNAQANGAKQITAMHAAGGFAGEMSAGGAAELGSVSLLGLGLDLTNLISALNVFSPCIKNASVHGYQSGLTVCAFGDPSHHENDKTHRLGDAGGYVGAVSGGQIWGDAADAANPNGGCNVYNLKKVQGVRNVGGYAGSIRSGSVADVNTNTDDGLFQGILDSVISTPSDLLTLLNATVSTIRKAEITVVDPAWGFTVEGWTDETDPEAPVRLRPVCAGGFAGSASGAVLGKRDGTTEITVNGLRGVEASEYAGGFVGLADVDGVATVASKGRTDILGLLNVGQVSLLDAFRPYVYYANVNGVSEGFVVKVVESEEAQQGLMASIVYTGCAGGFGGAVRDGTVEHSNVTQLSSVTGPNYVGGFIGFCGKSGVADVDNANVLGRLVGLQAGVGDAFGSTVTACTVTGIRRTENSNSVEIGYTVTANGKAQPIAGGFVGYGDLAQMNGCHASSLKYVESAGIAGGFIGRTSLAYLVEVQAGGTLLNTIVFIVNALLDVLNVGDLENLGVISLNLNPVLNLDVLTDGDLLYVDLLGLKIGVALNSDNTAAKVTIGDSYIELPVDEDGDISADDMPSNLTVRLIRINHTRTNDCTVTGVPAGYDVFGGGASQTEDGTDVNGCAGGFVGLNDESSFVRCRAIQCDVVRGTKGLVGPFSGKTKHDSVYENQNINSMEGGSNSYNGTAHDSSTQNEAVFETAAKVRLMDDLPLPANLQTMVPETADMQNPCLNRVDLTLHKIWDDMDGTLGQRRDADAEHPVTVTFTVKRVSKDANGAVIANSETTVQTVSLTAADENPFTKNVWTKKLTGLPATGTENGSTVYYAYTVTEAAMSGYVAGTEYADYDVTDKLTFGHTTDAEHTVDGGYVAKLTNQAAAEQTIVVDFGLPVRISIMDYLKAKFEYPVSGMQIAGILPISELDHVTRYSTLDGEKELLASVLDVNPNQQGDPTPAIPVWQNRTHQYGTFELPTLVEGETAQTKLRYVPGSMMFDKPVDIAVALRGTDGAYYYTKVKIVPATTIYYEEDFIKFFGGWSDAGTAQTGEQGEDRPGADVLDLNNIYGYDAQYSNSATYSLGAAKKVTVRAGDGPYAQFTFKGTGFDLLSVTDKTTGYMLVELYEGDTIKENQQPFVRWAVDTFYGCTRVEEGYIRYLCVWNGEQWRIAKTAYPKMTDEEAAQKIGTKEDGRDEVLKDWPDMAMNNNTTTPTSFVVYKKHYEWTTNKSNSTIYQVPVISSRGYLRNGKPLAYGTYTVVLKPQYAAFFDHDKTETDASYTLYVDGVRIYGPAEDLDEDYYLLDHEGWPQFLEMRKLLLEQGNGFGENPGELSMGVYIDGMNELGDLSNFAQYGPNNEIYLDPGQAIAFALKKGDSAMVDQIHVSIKQVFNGEASVVFASGTAEAPRQTELTLNTASECYYDLSSVIQWNEDNETGLIVISNPPSGTGTISLRNLKITYSEEVTDTDDLVSVKALEQNAGAKALRLLNRSVALPIILDDDPAFLGASISLESDFSLHFYVPETVLAGKTNPHVLFTKQTTDGPVVVCQYDYVEELVGDTLCRRYTFRNLSASEMGTEVSARLFYNDQGTDHMSNALTYSVKQYAMNMLEQTEDDALRTLLVDMLNYGAEAQKYFGVNVEQLANAELSEAQRAYATAAEPTLENQKAWISEKSAKVWFDGCSLSLERNVAINYYLDLSACGLPAKELILELTWKETDGSQHTTVIDGASFEARQFGDKTRYVAVLDELNAAQMRTEVSAVVRRKTNQSCISDTMRYSIVAYAQSKGTDPALRTLLLAMMKYGDAAEAYFRVH